MGTISLINNGNDEMSQPTAIVFGVGSVRGVGGAVFKENW